MAQTIEPILLNRRQTANALAISVRKLQDLTAPKGPIRSVKIGREHRYPREELARWLDSELSKGH